MNNGAFATSKDAAFAASKDAGLNLENILHRCSDNIGNMRDMIKHITDRGLVNQILDGWYQRYTYWNRTDKRDDKIGYYKDFVEVLGSLNPLLLDQKYIELIKNNPYEKPFHEWIKIVDDLKCPIPIPRGTETNKLLQANGQAVESMETKENELLFFCNNTPYYGDRKLVYGSMQLFQGIGDYIDFNEPIQLSGSINQNSMKVYLNSIHQRQINLNDIDPGDIINFIEFIDRYPTDRLSLNDISIDQELMCYFSAHHIDPGSIKEIIIRYGLKYMYLYMHNYNLSLGKNVEMITYCNDIKI